MGIIKFEVDIPNFEKELSINITLRRDGEVFYSTSSPSMGDINSVSDINFGKDSSVSDIVEDIILPEKPKKKKSEKVENVIDSSTSPKKSRGGNFMNLEI